MKGKKKEKNTIKETTDSGFYNDQANTEKEPEKSKAVRRIRNSCR